MANKTFPQLDAGSAAELTDIIAVEQTAGTRRLTLSQLSTLFNLQTTASPGFSKLKTYDSVPFKYCYYRNKEKDNNLSTADQTPITVAAVVSGGNITLANYPYDPSIINPVVGQEWQIRPADGNYENGYKITGGNLTTGVFQVSAAGSSPSLSLNEPVILMNPFRNVRFLDTAHMLKADSTVAWRNSQLASGPIFQHSDGHYVWIIQGNGSIYQLGFATADSLEGPWTWGNGDAPIVSGSDFNASYNYVSARESITYLPEEDRYAVVCGVADRSTAQPYKLGLWKFDENFENMEFIDDFYDWGSGDGTSQGSIIRFHNKWYLFTTHRGNASPYAAVWSFIFAVSDHIDGDWSPPSEISAGQTSGTAAATDYDEAANVGRNGQFFSGWIDMFCPFIYNDTLYVLVGATAYWSESGFAYNDTGTASNRQVGLFYLDENGHSFKPDPRGVVVMNAQDASTLLWAEYSELWDHTGAMGNVLVTDDGKVYVPLTIKGSSPNQYGIMIVELLIT